MPAFIDLPNGNIREKSFAIAGWVASKAAIPDVVLRVDGRPIPFAFYSRPDVVTALAGGGFTFTSGVTASVENGFLGMSEIVTLELSCDGESARKTCRLAQASIPHVPEVIALSPALTSQSPTPIVVVQPVDEKVIREESRMWCLNHLRCTRCGASSQRLNVAPSRIACSSCSAIFTQHAAAIDLLSADDRLRGGVVASENVSSNPYTPDALALIARATSSGGWALDCGAGARPQRRPHVVNLEIADYPSTDILGIGEALPFADASFDAVLSLAVLEHVRDPFACAREILRVLKPGGEALADVPLLQPVHGYPDHYYNMTRSGLANLFGGEVEIVEQTVPPHGHPIFAVQWLLGAYLGGLPDDVRATFGAMTVAELASLSPHRFLGEPAAALLAADTQVTIACVNSLRVRKRHA